MLSPDVIKSRLKQLQEKETQIKQFTQQVNRKIIELEESYLLETNLGNIIRGFDIDGKSQRLSLNHKPVIDAEKLFSCSSYEIWLENKTQQETVDLTNQKPNLHRANSALSQSTIHTESHIINNNNSNTTTTNNVTITTHHNTKQHALPPHPPKKKARKSIPSSSTSQIVTSIQQQASSKHDYDPDYGDY